MKIKEVIVVEGRDDTAAIKRAVDADTIETGGSAINEVTLRKIKIAQEKRGVIVFTDPDYPGERIRKIISQNVPGCKHAFIKRADAMKKRKVGVEHATPEVIREALSQVKTEFLEVESEITLEDLVQAGMIVGTDTKYRRTRLGEILGIGYSNAKQLIKRLQMFQISRDEFIAAVDQIEVEQEEANR
ncbi:ribonuclease M5 [Brevibacillus daliensis]|uniref:ribonuclease M5 n=1 Tax=Brevibacillus daliensis TaxID=2892995 RepID=UPI001E34E3BA|nr:ribonuclease M5 [Brevibacillus daliensis]